MSDLFTLDDLIENDTNVQTVSSALQSSQPAQQPIKNTEEKEKIAAQKSAQQSIPRYTEKNLPSFSFLLENPPHLIAVVRDLLPELYTEYRKREGIKKNIKQYLSIFVSSNDTKNPKYLELLKLSKELDSTDESFSQNLEDSVFELCQNIAFPQTAPIQNFYQPSSFLSPSPAVFDVPAQTTQQSNNKFPAQTTQQSNNKFLNPEYQELALCLAKINATSIQARNPKWLAEHCSLTIAEVQEASNSAQFRAYVSAVATNFQKELILRGYNQKISRLQAAQARLEDIEQIIFERGMYATFPEEVSDNELFQMGLDPRRRDLEAALQPGARRGLWKKTAVVLRTINASSSSSVNQSRGSRTQVVNTFEDNTALIREMRVLQEYIAKELNEFGKESVELRTTEMKLYKGFDPSIVGKK